MVAEGIKLATAYVEVSADTKSLVRDVSSAFDGVGKTAAANFGKNFTAAVTGHGKTAADQLGTGLSAGMTKHGGVAAQSFVQGFKSGLGPTSGRALLSGMFSSAGAIGKAGGIALGVGIVGGITAAVFEAGKALYSLGDTFDTVADAIANRTGVLGKDLDAITSSMNKVATSTASSLADIGDIGGRLVQSLHLTGSTLEQVTKQIADLNRQTGENTNVRDLGKLLRQFGVDAADVPAKIEELARASRATGIPVNELIQSLMDAAPAAKEFGVSFDQLVTFFGTFEEAGLNAEKVVPALSMALKKFAKDGKEPVQALHDLIAEIQRLSDAGDPRAIQLAADAFGRGYLPILDAIRSHKIDIDSLNASILNSGPSISQITNATADWSEKWRILKNDIVIALQPFAKGVFDVVNTELEKLATALENNRPAIIGFFTGLATAVAESVEGIVRTLGTLTDAVGDVVGLIGNTYANILDMTASVKDVLPWGDKDQVAQLREQANAARDWANGLHKSSQSMLDAADSLEGMRDRIQDAGDTANTAAQFVHDLNDAVVEVTDHDVILKTPTPEQLSAIDQAKYKLEAIPDSKDFKIIPLTDDAEQKLNAFRVQQGQKPLDLKVNTLFGPALEGLEKLRADVANNPLQIPTQLIGPGAGGVPGGAPGSSTSMFGPPLSPTATPPGGGNTAHFPTGTPAPGGNTGLIGPGATVPSATVPTGGGGAESWRSTVASIVAKSGVANPQAWTDALVRQISTESGGNPNAINPRDSDGLPAYGLLQFKTATFAAHNVTGGDLMDPVAQIAAAIDYVKNRWGVDANGAPLQIGRGVGYGTGGGVFGSGRGDRIPALLESGEHVLTRGDVSALGGQSGVYAMRRSLHMQSGGAVDIPEWVTQAAQAAGITPEAYLASLTLSATAGTGAPPGPSTGQVPGPVQDVADHAQGQQSSLAQTALGDAARFPGLEPTTTGTVGIAGTSFIAKALNIPNEFVGFLIDTGAEIAQSAISAAVAGGTMGMGAAAAPAAGQAAGFGLKIAAAEAKRLSSYGFQMAAIGIDSIIENLFSPIGGAPRWMGYDYTSFIPSIALQAGQVGVTTAEQAINQAITQGISGQGQPMGPVQPGQLPGAQQTTGPTPPFGESPPPPSTPPLEAMKGLGPVPGPSATQTGPSPEPTPQESNPLDLLKGMWGFDQGGWLQPGATGINLTRRPEPVLTPDQWANLSGPDSRKQWGVYVENIYAADAEDVSRQIAAKQRLAAMRYSGRP